jgi:hypothetical protein
MYLAINLHVHFVEMPFMVGPDTQTLNSFSTNVRRKQRTKTIPPKPNGLILNINFPLMQKIFHIL